MNGDLWAQVFISLQSYWRHPNTRWIAPGVAFLAALLSSSNVGSERPTWAGLVTAGLLGALTRALWTFTNRMPRVPKGHVGFVIAVTADNAAQERQLRADFVAQIRKLIEPDKQITRFYVLEMPQWVAKRCVDLPTAAQILSEARGHIMIYGVAKRRLLNAQDSHFLEIEGVVRHSPISDQARAALGSDFRSVLPPRVFFPVNNDAFAFAATSEWTEVAARYVIALAALVSGDVAYAEKLLLSVESRLRSGGKSAAPLQEVARKLPRRFIDLYNIWLGTLNEAYFVSRSRSFVEDGDRVASELLLRDPNHYAAQLFKALAHFVLRRDLWAARQAAFSCRRIKDQTWRYSYAFLLAYEGNTKKAREQYEIAFKGRVENVTVPVQVEEFMQLVLEEEPQMVQLHFFSGLVNLRAKNDLDGAERDLSQFMRLPDSAKYPDEVALAEKYLAEIKATRRRDGS